MSDTPRLRISALKGKGTDLTRTFAYPPNAAADEAFYLKLQYLSPALFEEEKQKAQVKHVGSGPKRQGQVNLRALRAELAKNVLAKAIKGVYNDEEMQTPGIKLDKLKGMLILEPEVVKEMGGLEAIVPMDEENIVELLTSSVELFDWLMEQVSDLSNYQDAEWEQILKN